MNTRNTKPNDYPSDQDTQSGPTAGQSAGHPVDSALAQQGDFEQPGTGHHGGAHHQGNLGGDVEPAVAQQGNYLDTAAAAETGGLGQSYGQSNVGRGQQGSYGSGQQTGTGVNHTDEVVWHYYRRNWQH